MDRVIKNLREQLILCRRLNELLDELSDKLQKSTAGDGITSTVQAIETVMPEMSKADTKLQEMLRAESIDNLHSFIERQPDGVERNVAERLINQVGTLQMELQKRLFNAGTLLVNSKKFIDFNMNVMSRATAGTTYGRHGNQTGGSSGRRIFDANI